MSSGASAESALRAPSPAVSLGGTLAGGVRIAPGTVLREAVPLAAERSWSAIVSSRWLSHSTFAPQKCLSEHPHIRTRIGDGYQDEPSHAQIQTFAELIALGPASVLPTAVVNARRRWLFDREQSALHVYDSAAAIWGQEVLAAYGQAWAASGIDRRVAVTVVDVSQAEEKLLYETLRGDRPQAQIPNVPRYSLKISTNPMDLEIQTEPFVVPGRRGYSPMVIVTEAGSDREHGLYVSAASLTLALEGIRERRGSLIGVRVRISRESSSPYAPYEVEEL